jgi:hypothetical protein
MLFGDARNVLIVFVMLALVSPFIGGSSCQTGSTMDTVRDVHTGIRGAFARADEFIAPRFEAAGDACIAEAQAAGLTGQEGADASDECMSVWLQLDQAVTLTREAMAELEEVYEDIDNGREADWQRIARRVLTHGRNVVRFLDELDIDGADDVISAMRTALDRVCDMVDCDGGES